jgi:hypothetical protein
METASVSAVLNALSSHPEIVIGVLVGVVLTAVVHAIRRVRRLITTGVVLAIAGGGAASGGSSLLQHLPHLH